MLESARSSAPTFNVLTLRTRKMHWGFGAQIKYEWENRHLSAASPARAARARRIRGLANLDRRATSICKTSRLAWGELKKIQEGADTPHFRAAGGGRSVRRYRFKVIVSPRELHSVEATSRRHHDDYSAASSRASQPAAAAAAAPTAAAAAAALSPYPVHQGYRCKSVISHNFTRSNNTPE
eukprot:COSAG06_NODE_23011_length_706_cov_1.227723_1_plen_181_part_00